MKTIPREIVADTHPPAYLVHKYWARKPHNVIAAILRDMVGPRGGVFLDPFCGSGVALSEAAKLGFICHGTDVNPTATSLSRLMLDPPDPREVCAAVAPLIDEVEEAHRDLYSVDRHTLRYCAHATTVLCPSCNGGVASTAASRLRRRYLCPQCGTRLNLNLEQLIATRIVQVTTDQGTLRDAAVCGAQTQQSQRVVFQGGERFDQPFPENRRVLAFPGMSTRRLFTSRNFSSVAMLADRMHGIRDTAIRTAALLSFTSGVAQASRLVPYRNDLRTGGQAWSVPGFWVAPLHLETNPFPHFRHRLKKLSRGLNELRAYRGRFAGHEVCGDPAERFLSAFRRKGLTADVIFLDPPYGDSVPYLEFSALWNSFLGTTPDPNLDISVSNRLPPDVAWSNYRAALVKISCLLVGVLAPHGHVVCTFNNHDLRAWSALLGGLQGAGLRASCVTYQLPAVVSAKAQLAPDGSYIGDFYCVFERSTAAPKKSLEPVRRALREAGATVMAGQGPVFATRVAIEAWLRANVCAELLDELPELIAVTLKQSSVA